MKYPNLRRAFLHFSTALMTTGMLLAQSSGTGDPTLPKDPNQYVREVIKREINAQDADHTHWRYHIHKEDEKGSYDRDVIETPQGKLARTLLINGRPLTAEQRRADEDRLQKLVSDPDTRNKQRKRDKDDGDKAEKMMQAIPDAFIFRYDGVQDGQVRLSFSPNPRYDAPNRELQVFKSMNGKMWVDHDARRLARIDGQLFEDVTFGWGLLGRLHKGGSFQVEQKDVGDNHWEVVSTDVNMTGHAIIFKTINVKEHQVLSGFRRVPDNLSMTEAYSMLKKGDGAVSENNPSTLKSQGNR